MFDPFNQFSPFAPQRPRRKLNLPPELDPFARLRALQEPDDEPPLPRASEGGGAPGPEDLPTPEEESGLLHNTLSGVEYLAESLGKGGYALRGLAAGRPEALLNLIPFYDTARSLTGAENSFLPEAPKVSGAELVEMAGGPAQDTWQGKALGFGAELIDPMMLVGMGGLTKAGLAAKAAKGALLAKEVEEATKLGGGAAKAVAMTLAKKELEKAPETLLKAAPTFANQIRKGERALMELRVPFTETPLASFGTGEGAARLAELGGYNPVSRYVRGLFSSVPGVGGQYTKAAQMAADAAAATMRPYYDAVVNAGPAIHNASVAWQDAFGKVAEALGKQGDTTAAADMDTLLRTMKEGLPEPEKMIAMVGEKLGVQPNTPAWDKLMEMGGSKQLWHDFKGAMENSVNAVHKEVVDYGGKVGTWHSPWERYAPRLATSSVWSNTDFMRERKFWLNKLPQSESTANAMTRDAILMGVRPLGAGEDAATLGGKVVGQFVKLDKAEHAELLQGYLKTVAGELAKEGELARAAALNKAVASGKLVEMQRAYAVEEHIRPVMDDLVKRGVAKPEEAADFLRKLVMEGSKTVNEGGVEVVKKLSSPIQRIVHGLNRLPKDVVNTGLFDHPEVDVWSQYVPRMLDKLYSLRTMHNFLRQPGVIVKEGEAGENLARVWDKLGFTQKGLEKFAASTGIPAKEIGKIQITAQAKKTLAAFKHMHDEVGVGEFGKVVDMLTSPFKAWWTTRIGFHVRNLGGGYWNSVADGEVNPISLAKNYGKLWKWAVTGKGDIGAVEEGVRSGLLGGDMLVDINGMRDIATSLQPGRLSGALKRAGHAIAHPIESWGTGALNPLRVGGKEGSKINVVTDVQVAMHRFVEFLNRGAYFQTLRDKGWSVADALHAVERAQFNYAKASPATKQFFNHAIPFFGWIRNNLPLQISRIVQRPMASPTGLAVKAMAEGPTLGGSFVPDWMREGSGVNLGGPSEATAFIRQAGLPVEDLNKLVFSKSGIPDVQRTLQKNFSMASPYIVAPVEAMANKQMYTGRPLNELQSVTGHPVVDSLLHYSPMATAVQDYENITDPRKGWLQKLLNLTTGVKVGTYDAERLRLIALQKALKEEIANQGNIVYEMTQPVIRRKYKGTAEAEPVKKQLKKLRGVDALYRKLMNERDLRKAKEAQGVA